jgi:hypothetical protein
VGPTAEPEFRVLITLDDMTFADRSPYVLASAGPFTCGSWTPFQVAVFVPGYGYFNTQCLQENNPPISTNWQQTYTIKSGVPGYLYRIYNSLYLISFEGAQPAVTGRFVAYAECDAR